MMSFLASIRSRLREWSSILAFAPSKYRRGTLIAAAVAGGLFLLFVAVGLHGSSIGIFANDPALSIRTADYSYPTFGKARLDRSDEWSVSTPQVLAQCASDRFFPRINEKIAGGADMFMSTPCNPVWDWTAIGQFHNWGYFLFGAEHGLAWNWWCRYLGIPLFAFLFFWKPLKDGFLSLTAAVAVTLGAPTVWWDTTIPFMLLYFFAALCAIRLIFQSSDRRLKSFGGVLLTISFLSFCYTGYPIFELLLLPGFLVLACAETRREGMEVGGDRPAGGDRKISWAVLAISLVAIAADLAYYFYVHAETLAIIRNSSYPGARIFRGGSLSEFLLTRSHDTLSFLAPFYFLKCFPQYMASNCCTTARYFVPGFALTTALFLMVPRFKLRRIVFLLLGYALVLLAWGLHQWPVWLAKATGFYLFAAERCDVIAGFFLLLVTFYLFSENLRTRYRTGRGVALPVAVLSILPTAILLFVPERRDFFFRSPLLIGSLVLLFILVWAIVFGFLRGNRTLFCCGYLMASLLSGLAVHPWSIGISPVRDTEFAEKVLELDRKDPGIWLANQTLTGNLLASLGVACIPGTLEYAFPQIWGKIDPDRVYEKEWNRYANTTVDIDAGDAFSAKAPRKAALRYNLTEKEIRALGVKHLVWTGRKIRSPWVKYEGRVFRKFFYTVLPEDEDAEP